MAELKSKIPTSEGISGLLSPVFGSFGIPTVLDSAFVIDLLKVVLFDGDFSELSSF